MDPQSVPMMYVPLQGPEPAWSPTPQCSGPMWPPQYPSPGVSPLVEIPNRVFVGALAYDTTELQLQENFKEFGTIRDTKVVTDRRGVSKGYGFVTFENQSEAEKVIKKGSLYINQKKINVARAYRKQYGQYSHYVNQEYYEGIANASMLYVRPALGQPLLQSSPTGLGQSSQSIPSPLFYTNQGLQTVGYLLRPPPTDPDHIVITASHQTQEEIPTNYATVGQYPCNPLHQQGRGLRLPLLPYPPPPQTSDYPSTSKPEIS